MPQPPPPIHLLLDPPPTGDPKAALADRGIVLVESGEIVAMIDGYSGEVGLAAINLSAAFVTVTLLDNGSGNTGIVVSNFSVSETVDHEFRLEKVLRTAFEDFQPRRALTILARPSWNWFLLNDKNTPGNQRTARQHLENLAGLLRNYTHHTMAGMQARQREYGDADKTSFERSVVVLRNPIARIFFGGVEDTEALRPLSIDDSRTIGLEQSPNAS
jgi:hypothetical protein